MNSRNEKKKDEALEDVSLFLVVFSALIGAVILTSQAMFKRKVLTGSVILLLLFIIFLLTKPSAKRIAVVSLTLDVGVAMPLLYRESRRRRLAEQSAQQALQEIKGDEGEIGSGDEDNVIGLA